ncbi:MAG: Gfo/Idh/MocA family protein [Acidimicrobiales bacterium]
MSPVGLGIVGLGRWARAHAEAVARTDSVHLVSCFSRNESGRSEFADAFDVEHRASAFEAMLENPEVEGVIVATPNDLHVEMALQVIDAGRPALVDKPVSVDLASGLRLLRAAPDGSTIGVAHHARRLAVIRAAKRWIDSSGGPVRFAHANFSNGRGAHLNPNAWHTRVAGSEAGVLIQVGIHQVENLLWLFGPVEAVNARLVSNTAKPVPDGSTLILSHASGVVSTLTSNWTTPGLFSLEAQCENGNIRGRVDHRFWKETSVDRESTLLVDTVDDHDVPIDLVVGDPLVEQLDELAATVRGEGSMEVDTAAGLRAMAVVLASVESSRLGGAEVAIDSMLRDAGATDSEVALLAGVG